MFRFALCSFLLLSLVAGLHGGEGTRRLGKLSERYESGGRGPGTVSTGAGDPGGISYGTYQLSSKMGRADAFVKRFYPELFKGLKAGTDEFTAQWKKLAREKPKELHDREHQYIKETHYDLLVKKVTKELGLNVEKRSWALREVIWSTAVQHGPNTRIVSTALMPLLQGNTVQQLSDEQIICAIYAERGRKDAEGRLVHFTRASTAVQKAVARRFENELRDALELRKAESR